MNIKKIITEAIDNTLLQKYSNIIKVNVNNLGKDPRFWSSYQSDKQTYNFIQKVFNYGYDIVEAVDSNNIQTPQEQQATARYDDSYGNSNNYGYKNAIGGAIGGAIKNGLNFGHGIYNQLRQQGLTLPMFDGVYTSAMNGYYNAKNTYDKNKYNFQRARANKQAQNLQQQNQQSPQRNTVNQGQSLTAIIKNNRQMVRDFQSFNARCGGSLTNSYVGKIINASSEIEKLLANP